MSQTRPHRVLVDAEAFYRQTRSGITRYLAELVRELRADPALGVEARTPYRFVASEHLAAEEPRRYRQVPLPARWRAPVLQRLNARTVRREPRADLAHHSLYEPGARERWPADRHVCTVYDFTTELLPELFPGWERDLEHKRDHLERSDGLLCISETTRDDLLRLHPQLDKPVHVTPLGVAPAFFAARPARPRGLPERYVLHVGNRHPHKNVDLLLEAFAAVAAQDPTLALVLCGKGPPGERERLQELGIERRTSLVRAADKDLPGLYAHAEAFVFPSLYEGFGLPVLEAMAAGCPTVVSDVPALREVAGEATVLIDPRDPAAIAAAVLELVADREAQQRLRAAGALRAADYTWRRTATSTAAAYDAVIRA